MENFEIVLTIMMSKVIPITRKIKVKILLITIVVIIVLIMTLIMMKVMTS